jgi:Spy/CpxP family protein refolding chaperone
MTKTFGLVTAAALLASVTAFAQNSTPSSDTAAPPAASDTKPMHKPMHKHHMKMTKMIKMTKGTDHDADKLNHCMSNATPTAEQESCLKQASGNNS